MPVRIFLSTVSDEFRDYRDQLRRDLTRHNVEVKVQEDFKDYGGVTLDTLDTYIKACDVVVHLVGDMTGPAAKPASAAAILAKYSDLPTKLHPLRQPLADGSDISYTQWEAWLALYHDKLLVIAKAAETASRGPRYALTDVSRAAQQQHLARLAAVERYPGSTPFTASDDLAKQILSGAILDMLAVADNRRLKIRTAAIAVVLVLGTLVGYLVWDRHLRNSDLATTLNQLAHEQLSAANIEEIEAVVRKKSPYLTPAQIDRFIQSLRDLKSDPSFARAVEEARNGNTRVAEGIWLQIYENRKKDQRRAQREQAEAARNLAASAIINSVAEGLKWYHEARSLDPDNMEGWLGSGDAAMATGTLQEADEAFLTYIALARRMNDEREISMGLNRHGDVLMAQGNLPEALKTYQANLVIADRLAKSDPDNTGSQRELSVSYGKVGDVFVAQGNLPEALKTYQANLAIANRLAKADPGNTGWQQDLSVSYIRVGNLLMAQGNLPEALKSFRDSLSIADRLSKFDPGNAGSHRQLSISYGKVGDVLMAQGNLPEALRSFRDSLAIADRLAQSDPGNARWQQDLSVSHNRVGDVLVAQGNLREALKSYQANLAISDRLAKSDPGNAGWQRELSVSYIKVGDVLMAQGNLLEVLKSYHDGQVTFDRLVQSDPGNAGWQQDLSVSYNRIGDVLVAQGNLPEALKSYQASLAIAGRLAKSDPGNAGWQRELSVSFANLASVLHRSNDNQKALDTLNQGRDIIVRLTTLSPDNASWQRDLAWFDAKIAQLSQLPDAAGQKWLDPQLLSVDRYYRQNASNAEHTETLIEHQADSVASGQQQLGGQKRLAGSRTFSSNEISNALKLDNSPRRGSPPSDDTYDRKFIDGLRENSASSLTPNDRQRVALIKQTPTIDLEVYFDYNGAKIADKSVPQLTELGNSLSDPAFKDTVFLIGGHTDIKGGESFTQLLSQRRAESVKKYLVDKFNLAANNLVTAGYGKQYLKNSADPTASENNRVEIRNLGRAIP